MVYYINHQIYKIPIYSNNRMGYNKLLNIAVSAVVKDNNILLIKRVKPPYAGYWAIPGGKVEFGEHPEEAAVREIKEETNIDCNFEELRGIASEIVHNPEGEKIAQFMLYVCKLRLLHSNIQMQKEGEVKWFNLNDLEKEKVVPSDLLMINEFLLKENKIDLYKIKMIEDNGEYNVEYFRR